MWFYKEIKRVSFEGKLTGPMRTLIVKPIYGIYVCCQVVIACIDEFTQQFNLYCVTMPDNVILQCFRWVFYCVCHLLSVYLSCLSLSLFFDIESHIESNMVRDKLSF